MNCQTSEKITICRSKLIGWDIRHFKCPHCSKRRFLVEYHAWYGPHFRCLNCGDEFDEDGRRQRPFMRGWREVAIEKHEKRLEKLEKYIPELKGNLLFEAPPQEGQE